MGFFSKFGRTKQKKKQSVNLENFTISNHEFNINSMFDDVVNASEAMSNKKGINLVFEIASNVPAKVISDRLHLGEVLLNLVDNAIAFTSKGEVRLKVERLQTENEEIRLLFSVIDTGVGIHPDALTDILIPFLNGDIASLDLFGLKGKGLYRSREIIKKMHGILDVKSKEGVGSTFSAELSLQAVDVNEKRHYRLPSTAAVALTVLIFEDNKQQAEALKTFLEYFRHTVSILEKLDLDSNLPELSSYDMIFISDKLMKRKYIEPLVFAKSNHNIKFVLVENIFQLGKGDKESLSIADQLIFKPYTQQTIFDLLVNLYGADTSDGRDLEILGSNKEKETASPEDQKKNQIFVVKDGMQRAGNDQRYFLKVLDNYLAIYDESTDDLLSLIEGKKYSALSKYSKEMKSVLANIGAYKLSYVASMLEKSSKLENDEESKKWIRLYQQDCSETLEAIDNYILLAMSKIEENK